ncbi:MULTISPECIES: DUF805 domain-containing protein [unclassified Rhizobium]|uniref:DUF805 domain-containing protein n=1 Tax=unclassified Rhizobium TaxID=2613769 RepID=UPI001601DF5A|nr:MULTISPECIES: DUF805 domain-containing protein [unclassified Rhizobium]MBB1249167.1 DUF805 domain-containing protein [Rhizobium sp. G21]MCV3767112.1 DUF805 domain-containing protein [Rhizobium sp. TRM95796]
MTFQDAVKSVLTTNYANFSGRARRSEYWWYVLFVFIASLVLGLIDEMVIGMGLLGGVFALATLIPGIAVGVRRLHDRDMSGWWLLIGFVPLVGWLILIYLFATPGASGENRFGPEPLA